MVTLTQISPRRDTSDLKARIDLRDFHLAEVGTGKRSGAALVDRVPWRDDRKPSFNIYADGWLDRATGDRGDIFAYVQRLHRLSFPQAVAYVASRYGADLPPRKILPKPANSLNQSKPPAAAWQRRHTALYVAAEQALWTPAGREMLDYLRNRGLTDATIRRQHLGFASAATMGRLFKSLPATTAIVIPWLSGGQLWAVKFRRLHGDEPKYIQLAGGNQAGALFGADALRPDKPVIFTEGEFDALLCQQEAGQLATFVTLGSATNHLAHRWREIIDAAPLVLLARDNDEAGKVNADKNTARLPASRQVLTVPTGKDATDYKTLHGGDLRAWITTALQQSYKLPGNPDGIRAAALNCKLDAAITVLELIRDAGLTRFEIPDLITVNQRLGRGLSESMLRRGVEQGVGPFLSKTDPVINTHTESSLIDQADSIADFERNRTVGGRKPGAVYTVLPLDQMKAALEVRLWYRLLESSFCIGSRELPAFTVAQCQGIEGEDAATLFEELRPIVLPELNKQDEANARWKFKAAHKAYQQLRAALDMAHSTPIKWLKGVKFAVLFYRAVHEADDRDRSKREIALITGRRSQNVGPILTRAGIKNEQRAEVIRVEIQAERNVAAQVYSAARGKGKVIGVTALKAGRKTAEWGVYQGQSPDLSTWGAGLGSATLEVRLQAKSHQVIVGEVQPPKPRQRGDQEGLAKVAAPAARPAVAKSPALRRAAPYTGPGHDPLWQRWYFLEIYRRQTGRDRLITPDGEILEDPTLKEVVDVLRGKSPAPRPDLPDPFAYVIDLVVALGGRVLEDGSARAASGLA